MKLRFIFPLVVFLIGPFSWALVESSFVVNQKPSSTFLTFDYTMEDHSFDKGSAKSHEIGFEIRQNLDTRRSVWARGQMVGTAYDTSTLNQKMGYGLGDISFGSKWGDVYDLVTVVYGLTGSVSPGMARNPRYGSVSQINSFSGYHTLAPYIGFESYSGAIAFGADAEVRFYSDIRYEDQGEAVTATNPDHFLPKLRAFAQVPVISGFEFGVQGAISRNNFSLDQLLLGSPGNQYEAEIYGLGKMDKQTQIFVAFTAKSLRYPLIDETSNVNVGLRLEQ